MLLDLLKKDRRRLRGFLTWFGKQPDEQFDQGSWLVDYNDDFQLIGHLVKNKCGTPACLGGHMEVYIYMRDRKYYEAHCGGRNLPVEEIVNWFHMDLLTDCLFEDPPSGYEGECLGKEEVVTVLEHLYETGKLDWSILDA